MINYRRILIIAIIEILLGTSVLTSNFLTILFGCNTKSASTLFFIVVSSLISTFLGIGLLYFKRIAYNLLLYFSSVIILSKILIFLQIIHLDGHVKIFVPLWLQNIVSIAYHGLIIFYLKKPKIRDILCR